MPDKRLLTGKKRISVWEKYRSEHPNPDLIPESDFGYINRLLKAQVAKCETHHTPLLVKEYERGLGDGEKHRLDRPELREKIHEITSLFARRTVGEVSKRNIEASKVTQFNTEADTEILALIPTEEEIRKQERERILEIVDDLLDSMGLGETNFPRSAWDRWQSLKGESK